MRNGYTILHIDKETGYEYKLTFRDKKIYARAGIETKEFDYRQTGNARRWVAHRIPNKEFNERRESEQQY